MDAHDHIEQVGRCCTLLLQSGRLADAHVGAAFQVGEPVFLVVPRGCAERAAGVPAFARTLANDDN